MYAVMARDVESVEMGVYSARGGCRSPCSWRCRAVAFLVLPCRVGYGWCLCFGAGLTFFGGICLALACLALPTTCLALPCRALPCLVFPSLALPCFAVCRSRLVCVGLQQYSRLFCSFLATLVLIFCSWGTLVVTFLCTPRPHMYVRVCVFCVVYVMPHRKHDTRCKGPLPLPLPLLLLLLSFSAQDVHNKLINLTPGTKYGASNDYLFVSSFCS